MNLDRLEKKIEKQAKNYDDYERLRFISMEKAKQKKSIIKNFFRIEKFGSTKMFDKNKEAEKSDEQASE